MFVTDLNLKKIFRFYAFVIAGVILIKTPQAWGFDVQRTQSYIETATQKQLWNERKWIKLGHYEKSLFSFSYTSPFVRGFFLSEEGARSPKAELLETIKVLYSNAKDPDLENHWQCRYLARTEWLNKVLNVSPEDRLPCKKIEAWKKELNVKSAAVIFAAADLGNASSSYGHTFLKIINPENARNKDLIDYGINYAANADSSEGFFYALKGLFGMYDGQFTMLPYHQKIREYINLEGRDIWEYHLNFTPEEVNTLVNHLIEMETARAPYLFFNDNCSYQILKALEVVRPQVNLSEGFGPFVIPIDTVKEMESLSKSPDLKIIEYKKYKKSLKTDYVESFSRLDSLQKKALDVAVEELKIPSDYELNPKEKAEVYEAAMKYYALKAFRTKQDFEDEKYKLYLERVDLGPVTSEQKGKPIPPPDESHDSSALYFGGTRREKTNSVLFKYKSAFHDLEQNDFGSVPFSHNEMGSVEFRYVDYAQDNEISKKNELEINYVRLLKLTNLNPVTQLDRPFSWKFQADIKKDWKPRVEGGYGMSFDWNLFDRARMATFIAARTDSDLNEDGKLTYLNSIGPNLLFVTRLTENIGLSAEAYYLFTIDQKPFFKYISKADYNFSRNWDLQLGFENHYNKDTEFTTQLVWNFIL